MYQPETPGRRKANPLLILLGVLIPAGIAGYAATTIGGIGKTHASAPSTQAKIVWTQGGENAGGQFENLTAAPLQDVALECYVNEPNEVRGITTSSERVAYHALFASAGQDAYRQWMMRFEGLGPAGQPTGPIAREAPTDLPPLVNIGPHESVNFMVRKSATTFPIELRATAQGKELVVTQVAPHY